MGQYPRWFPYTDIMFLVKITSKSFECHQFAVVWRLNEHHERRERFRWDFHFYHLVFGFLSLSFDWLLYGYLLGVITSNLIFRCCVNAMLNACYRERLIFLEFIGRISEHLRYMRSFTKCLDTRLIDWINVLGATVFCRHRRCRCRCPIIIYMMIQRTKNVDIYYFWYIWREKRSIKGHDKQSSMFTAENIIATSSTQRIRENDNEWELNFKKANRRWKALYSSAERMEQAHSYAIVSR